MSKPIEVGCVVEVVRSKDYPSWVGRTLVVTAINPSHKEPGALRYMTAPAPRPDATDRRRGWRRECLRRIDPPDWEAPRIEREELQA